MPLGSRLQPDDNHTDPAGSRRVLLAGTGPANTKGRGGEPTFAALVAAARGEATTVAGHPFRPNPTANLAGVGRDSTHVRQQNTSSCPRGLAPSGPGRDHRSGHADAGTTGG